MDLSKKNTRRRGEILETAILDAAWHELSEVGYDNLTMEKIAIRAKTNKAVLYRRWSNKSNLIIDTLHKYIPNPPNDIPNTGNLRNDVLYYLLDLIKPLKNISPQAIKYLITEHFKSSIIHSVPQVLHPRLKDNLSSPITTILKNAELRGEIKIDSLSSRIISLPVDLIRYEMLTKKEPLSDETIEYIVDNIFIPLIHIHSNINK